MSDTSPTSPSSDKNMEIYRKDFARGSKVLKEAAKEYSITTEPHKKAQLKKSMGEALKAMNEILNNTLHQKGEKYEKKLTDDYENFIQNSNTENMQKLNEDVDDIQDSL